MKLTQLATGLLLAGLMTGSALAADKIVIAHPWRQRLSAGAYAAGKSDGLCPGRGLSGAGSGDDEGRPAGRPARPLS